MTRVVLAGYYGFQNEDGMNYEPLPQQIFGDDITGWSIQDVTTGSAYASQATDSNRRVWLITSLTTEGVAALEANALCEIVS